MLTDAWFELRPHAQQYEAWTTKKRFVGLACGRGSGKTELARRRIVRYLSVTIPNNPNPMYFFALPTYTQARRVAWKQIKALVPEHWLAEPPREGDMLIRTKFGSELYVVGMDKPQRIEGNQWAGCVIDESCDQKPGVFETSVIPALTQWRAWCWRIGVPKRYGPGAAEYKRWFFEEDEDKLALSWPSSSVRTEEELRYAKKALAVDDYDEQMEAKWVTAKGRIFYGFDEKLNVTDKFDYIPSQPIFVGSDFNVDPMAWTLSHKAGDQWLTFDEVFKRNTNTERTLDALYEKYKDHTSGWIFIGDATGQARKSSASQSDYLHIANDTRFQNKKCLYPPSNPPVIDRFAACNAMFANKAGVRRAFIHPRCKELIKDLNDRAFKKGTREPNDTGDLGHISDAYGYPVYAIFPLPKIVVGSAGVQLNASVA